ncbi:MAG: VWA domain-containing protein [Eubacterium sp.]|nr:VWA domain-containing protein [Eubacterium sp.]
MNKSRHINGLMLVFSIIGGIIGYIFGEAIINFYMYRIPNVLLVGMYFGVFGLCVLTMCLLAEKIKPRLTGVKWQSKDWKNALIVIPLAAILMFGTGCLTQFIYGLNVKQVAAPPIDDYVFIIDDSGSMYGNDPQELRYSEVNKLIDELDDSKRVAYYLFSDTVTPVFDFQYATAAGKEQMHAAIDNAYNDGGGTDINGALTMALEDVKSQAIPGRSMALVLLSDGEDFFDTNPIIQECTKNNISVDCIGLGISMFSSGKIMNELADGTGGNYYDIQSADQLVGVFTNIKRHIGNSRLLLARRYGRERTTAIYGIERVIFIALFGLLLGTAIGAMFDNKQLFKNLLLGGAVTGLLAGLAMELGMYAYLNTRFCRTLMDILLSIVVCIFTAAISYEIKDEFAKPANQWDPTAMYGSQQVNQFGQSTTGNDYTGPIGRF